MAFFQFFRFFNFSILNLVDNVSVASEKQVLLEGSLPTLCLLSCFLRVYFSGTVGQVQIVHSCFPSSGTAIFNQSFVCFHDTVFVGVSFDPLESSMHALLLLIHEAMCRVSFFELPRTRVLE